MLFKNQVKTVKLINKTSVEGLLQNLSKLNSDLLGYSRLETTQIYLHLSSDYIRNVKSPLDNL